MDHDIQFRFWIPFKEGLGGVQTEIYADSLEGAIDDANAEAIAYLDSFSHTVDRDCPVIYFGTDEPFSVANLIEVECALDGDGVARMADEGDKEWASRVDAFVSEHADEDGHGES